VHARTSGMPLASEISLPFSLSLSPSLSLSLSLSLPLSFPVLSNTYESVIKPQPPAWVTDLTRRVRRNVERAFSSSRMRKERRRRRARRREESQRSARERAACVLGCVRASTELSALVPTELTATYFILRSIPAARPAESLRACGELVTNRALTSRCFRARCASRIKLPSGAALADVDSG